MGGFRKGWLSEPAPATGHDRSRTVLPPRFCIREQRGLHQPKYRLIDDIAKSLLNGAVQTSEIYYPKDLDSPVALSRLRTIHGAHHLRAWSHDSSHAYKTLALHPVSFEAAYICFTNPGGNRPCKSRILAQPFCSRRGPRELDRAVAFVQFIAFRLLHIAVGATSEDVYCADIAKLPKSIPLAPKQLFRILCFNASNKKARSQPVRPRYWAPMYPPPNLEFAPRRSVSA